LSAIKSILLHVDHSTQIARRVAAAVRLSEHFGAHLDAQYCVMAGMQLYPMLGLPVDVQRSLVDRDEERRRAARIIVDRAAETSERVTWVEEVVASAAQFAARARYADLCILGQDDPDDAESVDVWRGFAADVVVASGQPCLVLPWIPPPPAIGRRVIIAWSSTCEAARAVTAALPFLRAAEDVRLIGCGQYARRELAALQQRLQHHAIRTSTLALEKDDNGVGDMLLSEAAARGADLLVMGCYGHSRAREWTLGGTTKSIFQAMTVPVLMSH
jgi:nucleotide-binding universal stress UspA family protein